MIRFFSCQTELIFWTDVCFYKFSQPHNIVAVGCKTKMAYFATIFYLFMAQYALVLSADSSSWKDSDLGFLLQNKRTHQLQVIY